MTVLHGTAVAYQGRGVLILGASGAGKSGLALQLMALGGVLVADDAVQVALANGEVTLGCPASIHGMIEARGVGLLSVNAIERATLAFVVDLDKTAAERLPEPRTTSVLGVDYPVVWGKNNRDLAPVIRCLLGGGQIMPTK